MVKEQRQPRDCEDSDAVWSATKLQKSSNKPGEPSPPDHSYWTSRSLDVSVQMEAKGDELEK